MISRIAFLFFLLISANSAFSQNEEFIETQATITDIQTQRNAKRSTVTAKVDFVTESGDSISSQTTLMHIPFLGSSKEVGDTIAILYQKDNPYLIKSKNESFMQTYGWYVIGAVTLIYLFFRMRSRKNHKR